LSPFFSGFDTFLGLKMLNLKKNHVLFVNFEVKLLSDNEFHAEGEFFGFLSRVFALERIKSISFFDILFIHHFENHRKKGRLVCVESPPVCICFPVRLSKTRNPMK